MKFANFMIVTISTLLIYCTVQSSAIKCYHCNSHLDPACRDPFEQQSFYNGSADNSDLIDCSTLGSDKNYTFCRKTIQSTTLRPDKDEVRVIRSCGFLPEDRFNTKEGENPADLKCYRRVGTFGVELLYCGCHADGCNSANWLSSGGLLILACAIISIFYR